MLIIPVSSKIGWKNPPILTISLIVLNCFVFLVFQAGENVNMHNAMEHYVDSGLFRMEAPRYVEYCNSLSRETCPDDDPDQKRDKMYRLVLDIESDREFMDLLQGDLIVIPEEAVYAEWKQARSTFESKLKRVVFWEYGFRPAFPSATAMLTHMFLHGGYFHLIGNMVFLWFMGCIIEPGWGRLKFIALYFVSGIAAVSLFGAVYSDSGTPLVGASGAIAGLMGALTMLYAFKRIKIFYSLGFYFNYLHIRAWVLFPIWTGLEVYQLVFGGLSNVAYMAHIGGLIGGGVIGVVYRKWFLEVNQDILEEEAPDEISPMIEKALNHMGKLELDEARIILGDVLKKDPGNKTALKHMFTIDKTHPDKERLHNAAGNLLQMLFRDNDEQGILDFYREYTALVRPRLSPAQYIRIASAFAAAGLLPQAEALAKLLVSKKIDTPGLPELLIRIAARYRQAGQQDKFTELTGFVSSHYPEAVGYIRG